MNSVFNLSIIMPVLAAVGTMVIIIVLIVVHGKNRQIQNLAISQKSFEQLANELNADNAILKSELATIKETLNSINKMMKEI